MKRSLIAVAIAVVLAAVGATSILFYVDRADNRALEGKKVESVFMPATAVPADALSSIDASLDKLVITTELQPRQLVLRGAFGDDTKLSGGLSIPDGKLAVTVDVAGVPGLTGFVRPGAKVALFSIYDAVNPASRVPDGNKGPSYGKDANHITRLLMPRVEIVAIGTPGELGASTTTTDEARSVNGAEATDTKPAANLTAITFAVSQDEAERLILATTTSTVYLALLNDASDVRPGQGVDTKSLFP
jgi:pilus assembly protein CpaB